MSVNYSLREQWFGNVRGDILSGVLVALALIPEAIAFSLIAGVDPKVGLYAAFCIAVVTAIAGGRPGMISAATGAMALLMVDLVRDHGLQYLFAATILTGLLQLLAAALRLNSLMRFVSRSVVVGFVNALAILIFLAQLPELVGKSWQVYAVCAAGLAIIYLLPRLTRAVPSALVAIVVLTLAVGWLGWDIRTVGDMGHLPDSLPAFLLPDIPWTLDTLRILLPVSTTLAVVGLLESLMTAQIVEDMTDTPTNRRRECAGQGAANVVAGVVLLVLVVYASPWGSKIPMAALVAVMITVSIGTFHWKSFREFKTHPKTANLIMLGTVVVTVATHDLAKGVLTGVLLTALSFTRRVSAMLVVEDRPGTDGERIYEARGQVFFASAVQFANSFDYLHAPAKVVIDVRKAHFWDTSAVAALDRVVLKFRKHGAQVEVVGLNEASEWLVERLNTYRDESASLASGH